jgi:hypothetical protein
MDATNIQGGVRYHGGNRYEDRLEQANRAQYVKIQETDKTGVFSNAFSGDYLLHCHERDFPWTTKP